MKAWDLAIAAQAADLVGGEAFAGCGLAPLTIQNAGDDPVRIEG
jgi:hypothetical protein